MLPGCALIVAQPAVPARTRTNMAARGRSIRSAALLPSVGRIFLAQIAVSCGPFFLQEARSESADRVVRRSPFLRPQIRAPPAAGHVRIQQIPHPYRTANFFLEAARLWF